MKRVEELTLRLLDGDLSDGELAELETLIARDPAAAAAHLALLDVEVELRAQGRDPGLARAAMGRLKESLRLKKGVMKRIRDTRRRRWLAGLIAAGLLVGCAVWVTVGRGGGEGDVAVIPREPAPGRKIPAETKRPSERPPAPVVPEALPPPAPAPSPSPAPAPSVPAPAAPRPAEVKPELAKAAAPREPAPAATVPAVASLERLEGDVYVAGAGERAPARAKQDLREGQDLEVVGRLSLAVVVYPDGTRLEAAGDTALRSFAVTGGKRVSVECGLVSAEVAKQPRGQTMVFVTPQGEARVLGTRLRLVVAPHATGSTRLEVYEGRVSLAREGRSVDVSEDHFAVAAPGLPLSAKSLPQGTPPPDPHRVDEAIRRGVSFLRTAGPASQALSAGFAINTDELVLWTLLHAGVPETDPKFQELFKKVVQSPLERTYKVALRAMILEEMDRAKYQEWIAQCAQFLADNQGKDGQWSYGEPTEFAKDPPAPKDVATVEKFRTFVPVAPGQGRKKPAVARTLQVRKRKEGPPTGDLSNSQYAALGLRACFEAGVSVPPEVVLRAAHAWRQTQHGETKGAYAVGGWCYDEDDDHAPYGSMTAGAVGSLVIYDHLLGRDQWKRDSHVAAGVNWLSKYFTVLENPFPPGSPASSRAARGAFYYYWLYSLERLGGLARLDKFGPHEWYPLGAKAILDAQQPDGSWRDDSKYSKPQWETCFAILFLRRPTQPVASVDKYQQKK